MKLLLILIPFLFLFACDATTEGTQHGACEDVVCGSGATCQVVNDRASCECTNPDHTYEPGSGCVSPCDGITCSNHGTCIVDENKQPKCDCSTNYVAVGTECRLQDNDQCKLNNITCDGGECNPNTGLCQCPEGTHFVATDGNSGTCEKNSGCEDVNCGAGTCIEDLEGDYRCDCHSGYLYNSNQKICVKDACAICNSETCIPGVQCGIMCCSTGEFCLEGVCRSLADCEDDFGCPPDQFCDDIIKKCVDIADQDDPDSCSYTPNATQDEDIDLLVSWEWEIPSEKTTFQNVIMPPVVANMTDDNHDNKIDTSDVPDIIFSTYAINEASFVAESYVRVISGDSGKEHYTITDYTVDGGSALAVGDIDNDGKNEIVAIKTGNQKMIAFNNDGSLLWIQDTELDFNLAGGGAASGAPAIADMDQDGYPEVIIGNYILNGQTGEEICHGETDSHGNNTDAPTNAHNRYITVVENVDNDNYMDIVTGNTIISGNNCQVTVTTEDESRLDGYTAVADLNLDGVVDIVTVSNGMLYIYNIVGNKMVDMIDPFEIDAAFESKYPIGGPPTIANFDSDANLEIAVAGSDFYSVIKPDFVKGSNGTDYLWQQPTNDRSSRQTGSSLFDFEGDGKAEVLYADECYFRIYDSETGRVRFEIENTSATIFEYPLVVDVDGDGRSEIVLSSNNSYNNNEATAACPWVQAKTWSSGETRGTYGIRVFEDAHNEWVRTRKIWNQHSYHITNVKENGTIPTIETKNWSTFNNYRLNTQGKGIFNLPNFVIEQIQVERVDCPELNFIFTIRVANLGTVSVPAGVPVALYQGYFAEGQDPNTEQLLGVAHTTEALWPGKREDISFTFTPENPDDIRWYHVFVTANDTGNGSSAYPECEEQDNTMAYNFKGSYAVFCQKGVGQCMRFDNYRCNDDGALECGAASGTPEEEICDNGLDDNCNGQTDENCGCEGTQSCYSGYAESFDTDNPKSLCKRGTQTCYGGESWSECQGDVLPVPEICDGFDNDCDGKVDEIFTVGATCVVGLGACQVTGTFVCDESGSGNQVCNATANEPGLEICDDGIDNDCDGKRDENPCQKPQ